MTTEYGPGDDLRKLVDKLADCHKWVENTHGDDLTEAAKLAPSLGDRKRVALSGHIRCVNSSRAVKDLVLLSLGDRKYAVIVTISVRPMIEWYVRAYWLSSVADEQEADKFIGREDHPPDLRLPLGKLIKVVAEQNQKDKLLIEHLENRIDALNNFLHGGSDVLAGRVREGQATHEVSDHQVTQDIHALGCVMFLACESILRAIDADQTRIDRLREQRDEFRGLFKFDSP